jgi:hypothetical protein
MENHRLAIVGLLFQLTPERDTRVNHFRKKLLPMSFASQTRFVSPPAIILPE